MSTTSRHTFARGLAVSIAVVLLVCAPAAQARKLLELEGHLGGQVNSDGSGVCLASETCQTGREGAGAGWFAYPQSVAVNQETHDLYVADKSNQRIQEISETGGFLRTWGAGVISGAVRATGTLTAGSAIVREVALTQGSFVKGQTVSGAGIPSGAIVLAIGPRYYGTTFVPIGALLLSKAATASGTGVALSVSEGVGYNGATAPEVCAAATECEVGQALESTAAVAGAFSYPQDVTVDNTCWEAGLTGAACTSADPSNGDVYVLEEKNDRVDKFEADGKFVLMIGREVNVAKTAAVQAKGGTPTASELEEENVCLAGETCQAGKAVAYPANVNGAFQEAPGAMGGLLAVGGPSHLLFVADEGRVQEFNPTGAWVGAVPLSHAKDVASALALDAAGNLYVAESQSVSANKTTGELAPAGVREFLYNKTSGKYEEQAAPFQATSTMVESLTFDATGALTITEASQSIEGVLFSLTGEPDPFGMQAGKSLVGRGIAYDKTSGRLYAAPSDLSEAFGQEINLFKPVFTPDVVSGTATEVTATSAKLSGTVNAAEEPETNPPSLTANSSYEYGRCEPPPRTCPQSPYGQTAATTPGQESGKTTVAVQMKLTGLWPNQPYHYRLTANNKYGTSVGDEQEFTTQSLPPTIGTAPETSFVRSESAVFNGTLNPENALTKYHFEYVTQAQFQSSGWAGAASTPEVQSGAYEDVALTQEATGLLPSTAYHVRLAAQNTTLKGAHETTAGPEAIFTTLQPVALQAITDYPPSEQTATSAVIFGQVDPGGAPAVYEFEVGVYDPAGTQFGLVASASAGEGTSMEPESVQLSGLQPGTTYAYRIRIQSSYGSASGAVATFTTASLPTGLTPPPVVQQLPIPPISFPTSKTGNGKPPARCRVKAKRIKNARRRKKALQRCTAKAHKHKHHDKRAHKANQQSHRP